MRLDLFDCAFLYLWIPGSIQRLSLSVTDKFFPEWEMERVHVQRMSRGSVINCCMEVI